MKEHYWYSEKQKNEMIKNRRFSIKKDIFEVFVELENGDIVEYTECANNKNPRTWKDAKYLGCGKFHHAERMIL